MLRTGLDIVVARLARINRSRLSQMEWSARRITSERAKQIERAMQSAGARPDGGSAA